MAVVLAACGSSASGPSPHTEAYYTEAPDDCSILKGSGLVVTKLDAEALRFGFSPPPGPGPASRLAADVFLAQIDARGAVEPLPPKERIAVYRRWLDRVAEDREIEGTTEVERAMHAIAVVRDRVDGEFGPCHVTGDAGSAP